MAGISQRFWPARLKASDPVKILKQSLSEEQAEEEKLRKISAELINIKSASDRGLKNAIVFRRLNFKTRWVSA